MTVLFWDIDGTLLTTEKAGLIAWNDAVKAVTGREFDLRGSLRTAGYTDYQIAVRTFELLGIDADDASFEALVRCYEERLSVSLPRRRGRVLDNVREVLEHLRAERPDVRSYLLTGNTPRGARAKLTHYGLMEFFPSGAFSVDTGGRASIAVRALELARGGGPVARDGVYVIGDTPHDIECARAIDARMIAVATGDYGLDELTSHRPWCALEALPGPEAFVRLLERRNEPVGGVAANREDRAR